MEFTLHFRCIDIIRSNFKTEQEAREHVQNMEAI